MHYYIYVNHQMDVNRSKGDYSQQLYSFKYHFYKNLVEIKICQHGHTTNDFYFPTGGLSEPCYNQIMVHLAVADPGGALGAQAPPSPHFWGPRLYSEAQIAPFYTQQKNVQKIFALLRSAYYFNSQLTYFDQNH